MVHGTTARAVSRVRFEHVSWPDTSGLRQARHRPTGTATTARGWVRIDPANAAANTPALFLRRIGTYKRKMPAALSGKTLYTQVLTFDQRVFVGAISIRTNVVF